MFKNQITITFVLIVAIVLLAFLNLKQCNDSKSIKANNNLYLSNLKALNDTVKLEKDKAGQIEFSKQSLIAENGSLKELNKNLDDQVKKEKGKVIYIESSTGEVNDTPKTINYVLDKISDTEFSITSNLDVYYDSNNHRNFDVITTIKIDSNRNVTVLKSELAKDSLGFNIVTGLTQDGKNLRIFIRSDYPGLNFTKIDGSLIDPTKSDVIKSFFPNKKWSIGPQLGIGINSQLKAGFYVGFGLSYNIIQW